MAKNVSIFNDKSFQIPGPTDYNINQMATLENTPKYSIKGKHPDLS
jgi:hypothetical protein